MWKVMDWNADLTEEIILAEFETRNEAIHFIAIQRGSWIEESQEKVFYNATLLDN